MAAMETNDTYTRRRRSLPRRDGLTTRALVLNAAGQVFAERGFAEATTREICERAGSNSAAVNYYFGGKEGLYDAVLAEAHRQIVSLSEMQAVMGSDKPAEEKLRAFFAIAMRAASSAPELWGVKVILRELAFPSADLPPSLKKEILPKVRIMRRLIAQIVGVPPESVEAAHAAFMVVMPCAFMVLFSGKIQGAILPELTERELMTDAMLTYALGGLAALRKKAAAEG
jgi:AcrR family transcriptional regulator